MRPWVSGYHRNRGVMEKDSTTITPADSPADGPKEPQLREMSLAKAKKLIQRTSKQHDGLFRRLAK
jgi:hypothetical protein